MTTRKRIAILFVVTGIGLIVARVVAFAGSGGDAVGIDEPSTVRIDDNSAHPAAAADSVLHVDRLEARRAPALEEVGALFEPRSWQPPPSKPVLAASEPPPRPTPPAFPYAYMGRMADGASRTAYFSNGDRVLALKVGDTVDTAYRVEQINESQMTVTYLPLNESMTVALGGNR